jgi:predicted aspartyl protease
LGGANPEEETMIDDMGMFRTTIRVAHLAKSTNQRTLSDVMVDTGSEYNWIPREVLEALDVVAERAEAFETADGRVLTRQVGFARIFAADRSGITAVVFAEPGDMVLLGAHGLESLNLRIDLGRKELTPAGPGPAAAAA